MSVHDGDVYILAGLHNVRNAAAAAAIATALDIEPPTIAAGLAAATPVGGRLAELAGRDGSTLIDDSYNANPTSVAAAASILAARGGRGIFVLGDMGELGAEAIALHQGAGIAIRNAGVERLFATGPLSRAAVDSFGEGGDWFDDVDALVDGLVRCLGPDVTVLVKGSRAAMMERVVNALAAMPKAAGEAH